MNLPLHVQSTIDRYHLLTPGRAVVVGVSGGPDSLCLLHLLWRLRERYNISLQAAHLHHQIRGSDADADAEFVRGIAESWQIPLTIERRDVPALAAKRKLALEEAARVARYSFLVQVARAVGAADIAVGHNADDQVETVLMHWLRGAGLAGLRGMTPVTWLRDLRLDLEGGAELASASPLRLIRPLLEVPRAEIERYCQEQGLRPRFDRSNLDTTFFRNRLRHELIPLLESYNPNIREVIRRSASLIADEYDYLRQALEDVWPTLVIAESQRAILFKLAEWRALPVSLQRSTLREAIHHLRPPLRNINWIHVENALDVLRSGFTGMAATLPQGLIARIGYDRFIVADEDYTELLGFGGPFVDWPMLLVPQIELVVPGATPLPNSPWQVETEVIPRDALPPDALRNPNPWQAYLDLSATGVALVLRQRWPGDRFQPLGMGGAEKSLSEVMINDKIPSQWRDKIPVLVSPAHILWIGGGRVDERARIRPETRQVLHILFRKHQVIEENS